ncbi:ABC transporter permease [Pseudonocardia sp. MH-G8]|uniref:ABC transporter permease n=1 Tax=Pseudonocardia sp. MH-G8 TaxID=1854588 RepID=UPI000BA0807D|nr:ABC transporter permease [Pseudonocardia sp. MH-G8]OZM77906.1 ribose ABC transporter permease [Pseudonocardia sp. MH-G8]
MTEQTTSTDSRAHASGPDGGRSGEAVAPGTGPRPSALTALARTVLAGGAPLLVFAVLLVVTFVLSPNFFGLDNLINVARQAAIVGVVAVGATFVILSGGIDLSVGSILAVVGVACAMLADSGMSPVLVLLIGLLIGLAFGILSGLGVAYLGVQPFIMTLAMLVIARGVALRISGGGPQAFTIDSAVWDFFGSAEIGPVPGPLIIFLVVAAAAWVVLRYTPFGRKVYAVGGNVEVARLSGVRVNRIRISVYAISGLTAALAGLMTAARLRVGAPTAGNLMELEAIAAVVIGGTSLMGGIGGVTGAVLGAVLLAVLANLLNLLGVDAFDQQIVRGVIIVAAVVITSTALRMRRRTRTR